MNERNGVGTGAFAPLDQIDEEHERHFDNQFNVNVKGFLFNGQKALPLLQYGVSIVLNASIVSSTGPARNKGKRHQSRRSSNAWHKTPWELRNSKSIGTSKPQSEKSR